MKNLQQRNIVLALNFLQLLILLSAGVLFFALSRLMYFCENGEFQICIFNALFFLGIPFFIGSLAIWALLSYSRFARRYLWIYSIFTAILLMPVGTPIGVYTVLYLRKNQ